MFSHRFMLKTSWVMLKQRFYQKNGEMLSKILRFAGVPVRQVDFFGSDFIVAASEEPGIRIVSTSSADKVHPNKTFDCT